MRRTARCASSRARPTRPPRSRTEASRDSPGKPEHVRELKLDYDDGMQLYEGEIFYNFREYEFEINAVTGEVVGWEID